MSPAFHTTRWSIVGAAGGADATKKQAALEDLCSAYWSPLFAFLRARGRSAEEAADLVQGLFAQLLERQSFGAVEREGGRFRNWLLTALLHHERDVLARDGALKRGGRAAKISLDAGKGELRFSGAHAKGLAPEQVFERAWVQEVISGAVRKVRAEHVARGRGRTFELLEPAVAGELDAQQRAAAAAALDLGPVALRVAVHRLRARVRDAIMAAVRDTVQDPADERDELEQLLTALREENG